jgi:hypothetical protein
MAVNDPRVERPQTSGRGVSTAVIVVVVIVGLALLAMALGLFSVESEGKLTAPDVEVSGGSVPDVDVNTADAQ